MPLRKRRSPPLPSTLGPVAPLARAPGAALLALGAILFMRRRRRRMLAAAAAAADEESPAAGKVSACGSSVSPPWQQRCHGHDARVRVVYITASATLQVWA